VSPIALGTFTPPPTGGKAGSFDPRYNANKPLIVVPREFRPQFVTQRFPNPKDVVICDVVDVAANVVHVSVIWGAEAIVDHIKRYVPTDGTAPDPLPVKIVTVTGQKGNAYGKLVPLEGPELDYVAGWDAAFPGRIDAERGAKIAADQAAQLVPAPAVAPMWGQAPGATQMPAAQPQWAGQPAAQNYAPPAQPQAPAQPQWTPQPAVQPVYQAPAQPAPVAQPQWTPQPQVAAPAAPAQPQWTAPAAAPAPVAQPAPVAAPPAFDVEAAIAGLREQQATAS